MKTKNLLLAFFFFACCVSVQGQFIPFSLYTNSPVLTNAAYPGTHEKQEAWLNYRQSRIANNKTPAFTYSHPLHSRSGRKFGGASATLINESWANGLFRMSGIETGAAYSVQFSSKHFLSMGMQGGLNMRGWDDSKITTSSQYVRGTFNPALTNGEQMNTLKETLFSLHAGMLWYWNDHTGRPKGQLGLSTRNINRPRHKLFEDGQRETVTYIFSGSMNLWEQGRMMIEPSFRYFHYKQSLANIGIMTHYRVKDQVNTTVGLWYKTNKALSLMLQVSQGPFLMAVGFDLDAAPKLSAKNNNAFELSLGWRMKSNKKNRTISSIRPQATPVHVKAEPLSLESTEPKLEEPEHAKPEPEVKSEDPEPVILQVPEEKSETIAKEPIMELSEEEKKMFSEPIHFGLGQTHLSPEAEAQIRELCALLKKYPQYTITVFGHSCPLGEPKANDRIAMQRAEEVKLIFVKRGVNEGRIKTVDKSFHEPIAPNTTEAGRAKNRRVEIKVNQEDE